MILLFSFFDIIKKTRNFNFTFFWIILSIIAGIFSIGMTTSPVFAERGIEDILNEGGVYEEPNLPTLNSVSTAPEEKVNSIVYSIIKVILEISGLFAVILIVIGGARYTMSAGDDDMINGAKSMILYALAGLTVIIFSYAILTNIISIAEISEK